MNPEAFLYCVESSGGEDVAFVVASTLSLALAKWKKQVCDYINEDYVSEGITDRVITPDDIEDPDSIQLIAEPGQLML